MTLLMPDTEKKREVVATWLESLGFDSELSDVETEDDTDWEITFAHEDDDHLYHVDWTHASDRLELGAEVEVDDDSQKAFEWLGLIDQILFLGDLIDCISSHGIDFGFVHQRREDDEKDRPNMPTLERITITSRLLADEGISRTLFFERCNLLRSVARRVDVRVDRMHLLRRRT